MSARVIVTGAAGGIGGAATAALRARGVRVIGLDLAADPANDVLACDVRDQASVDVAVAEAIARLGGLGAETPPAARILRLTGMLTVAIGAVLVVVGLVA